MSQVRRAVSAMAEGKDDKRCCHPLARRRERGRDRFFAEMAHIRVEGLRSGNAQKNTAEYQKAGNSAGEEIGQPVTRIESGNYRRVLHNSRDSHESHGDEPYKHQWPKGLPDPSGAL